MKGGLSTRSLSDNGRVLRLSAQPGIADIAELHCCLQESLAAKTPIIIEAETVERIDGAVMQLLFSFCQTAASAGIDLYWQRPSQTLIQMAELSGLSGVMGLDKILDPDTES